MSRAQDELEADFEALARDGFCASVADAARAAVQLLTPPENISTTDCAAAHRYIATGEGDGISLWSASLTPYINGIQDALDDGLVRVVAVPGAARTGKALALDTPIPTADGWSTMGDLQVGDRLFDEAGRPCGVTYVTDVMHDHECYVVTFSDGAQIVADADHEWAVRHIYGKPKRWVSSVLTTATMAKKARKRPFYSVDVAGSLTLPDADLPVPPYTLGAWLGDGTSRDCTLTIHEADLAIGAGIEADGFEIEQRNRTATGILTLAIKVPGNTREICPRGHVISEVGRYACGSCKTCARQKTYQRKYGIPRDPICKPRNLQSTLRGLGISPIKRIPPEYLRASEAQRMALLQGLMDTDGTAEKAGGCVSFTSTSEGLAGDVLELVRSLGFKPSIKRRRSFMYVAGGRQQCADAFTVAFTAYADRPVFRLDRKAQRQRPAHLGRQSETGRRRIVSIEKVASVPVRCIQVDSPSHLYLAGKEMIPTHNTVAPENHLFKRMKFGPMSDVLWYMPGGLLDDYIDTTVAPLFDLHPDVAAKVGRGKSDNKRGLKKVAGRFVRWVAANLSNIRNKKAPFIVGDEIDGFPKALRSNFRQQVAIRARTFGNAWKAYLCSHPDLGWKSGIASVWMESSRGLWFWPCPHCAQFSSPCPTADWRMKLDFTRLKNRSDDDVLDHVEATACMICPHCGGVILDEDKRGMNLAGVWVFEGQTIALDGTVSGDARLVNQTAGFWIHGTMSPFVTWGQLAREYVGALIFFERTGNADRLKEITAKSLGEVYEGPTGRAIDAKRLKARMDAEAPDDTRYERGQVPGWVRFITSAVDVGGNKFDTLFVGWGADGESALIERETLTSTETGEKLQPPLRQEHWDILRRRVLERRFPIRGRPGWTLGVANMTFDTGGAPGTTAQAWEFTRRMIMGPMRAEQYRLRPIKGASKKTAPEIGIPREVNRDDQGRPIEPAIHITDLGVFRLKELVLERMAIDAPGPGFMHMPCDGDPKWAEELTNEPLVDGAFERRGDNETFDLYGYAEAGRLMLKPDRIEIDWTNRPPPWARPKQQAAPTEPVQQTMPEQNRAPSDPSREAAEKRRKLIERISR